MESSWAGERLFGVLWRVSGLESSGFGGDVESSGLGVLWRVPGLESDGLGALWRAVVWG